MTTLTPDQQSELLSALRRIAQTPLWGETITDTQLRHDFIYSGEYDMAEDEFNPSADTESTQLRDAVEDARTAIAALEGRGS
jgi:hypothetical protein